MERKQKREAKENFLKDNVSQAKFEEFFVKFKKDKIDGGDDSWKDELSPYEVEDVAEDLAGLNLSDNSDAGSDSEY
jgi:hypothetical protein